MFKDKVFKANKLLKMLKFLIPAKSPINKNNLFQKVDKVWFKVKVKNKV